MKIENGFQRKKSVDYSSLIYGKVPPQAKDLEGAILGAAMLERDAFVIASEFLFQEAFYVDAHQEIYAAMLELYDKGQPIDLLTVVEALRSRGTLSSVGDAWYVTQLTNSVVSSAHIDTHCKLILQAYAKRDGIRIAMKLLNDCYDEEVDAYDALNDADGEIVNTQERSLKGETTSIMTFCMKVAEQYDAVKATGVLGIPTGFTAVNKIICGLVAPDLIIIAARPGQGKTAFALSLTHNVTIASRVPGGWFTLEMDGTQLSRRLASIDSGVWHERIKTGTCDEYEERKFRSSLERIGNSPIYIDDKSGISMRYLRTKAYIWKRKYKIQYIVVDYLQLMQGADVKNKNREQVISEISRGLKELAKELEMPIIALSQLSRECEKRPDKIPQLSDLRESGAIEQDADEVIFLMRPAYYGFKDDVDIMGVMYAPQRLVVVKCAKNRHGETTSVPLMYNGPTMCFTDYEENSDFVRIPVPQEGNPKYWDRQLPPSDRTDDETQNDDQLF